MRLAPESHKHIESFLRDHLRIDGLRLPPVVIHTGLLARCVTRAFNILAITFGRRILVAPKLVERDSNGRLTIPARLIAHEATHVVQYAQAGFPGFLYGYLREYRRGLKDHGGIDKAARQAAYLGIKYEREAYAAEHAYIVWRPPPGR